MQHYEKITKCKAFLCCSLVNVFMLFRLSLNIYSYIAIAFSLHFSHLLQEKGFTLEEFNIMCSLSSWATSGERKNPSICAAVDYLQR